MAFDRLIYIDRLKDAGVDEGVARARAEALCDALGETVATKADLADAVREMKDSVAVLDRKMDTNFATLDRKVDTNFATLDRKADTNFATLDRKADINFATLDRKIDALGSTLTIRAGSAFLFLVTLIVGLKYFG